VHFDLACDLNIWSDLWFACMLQSQIKIAKKHINFQEWSTKHKIDNHSKMGCESPALFIGFLPIGN